MKSPGSTRFLEPAASYEVVAKAGGRRTDLPKDHGPAVVPLRPDGAGRPSEGRADCHAFVAGRAVRLRWAMFTEELLVFGFGPPAHVDLLLACVEVWFRQQAFPAHWLPRSWRFAGRYRRPSVSQTSEAAEIMPVSQGMKKT